jgi:tRNA dimethylallyltransferase
MKTNYLLTIIGPTAIGKTALSLALANHFGSEIVSCDSRQFYKEMQIGTAVPSQTELSIAPHHFIQTKSIFEPYSVGDFEREALQKIEELFTQQNVQIMVGGSGLYVDAILKGFDDFPIIEPSVREEIKREYETKGLIYLQETLEKTDFNYFQTLRKENPQTLQNPQRMMRFVEVSIGSGKPYSSFLNQKKNTRNFTPIIIGLEAEREIMHDRINRRVDLMMQEGLLGEVKKLYPNRHLNALQTVGYRELFDYFDEKSSLDFAIEEIKKNTRRFAKRQLTWFKRTDDVKWFDYEEAISTITKSVEERII